MQGFDPITLEWAGESYTVPASRQMELILRVEEGLLKGHNGQAYDILVRPAGPPLAQFSGVYADALRYAGAKVEPIEVFRAITGNIGSGDGTMLQGAIMDVLRILNLLGGESDGKAKTEAPAKK